MVVGADALDGAQRPRPKAGAGTVGDAEIHRHADQRDLKIAEIGIFRIDFLQRRVEQGRYAGIGGGTGAGCIEDLVATARNSGSWMLPP